jgi:hypothetical protein
LKTPVILRVYKSNQLKEVRQFDLDQIVIGHEADVQLDLSDEAVSPIHCLIELREGGYYLSDLGSKTGTYKNGKAVLDEPLNSGDEIVIGPFKINFFVGIPKPKTGAVTSEPSTNQGAFDPDKTQVVDHAKAVPVTPSPVAKPQSAPTKSAASETKPKPVSAPAPKAQAASLKPELRPVIRYESKTKKRKKISFAPASEIKDLGSVLKPTKGSVVELIVAWKERVLTTYHFKNKSVVRVGSTANEQLQFHGAKLPQGWPLIEIGSAVKINLHPEMNADLVTSQGGQDLSSMLSSGKATKFAQGHQLRLDQNEVLHATLPGGQLNLYFRFVPQAPSVPMAPMFLTGTELSGVVLSLIVSAVLAFYISAVAPQEDQKKEEEVTRIAQVIFNKPVVNNEKTPPPPKTPPVPPPEVKPPPPKPLDKAKASDQKREQQVKGAPTDQQKAQKAALAQRANEVAPIPNSQNRPKKFTSTKQGGAVKIGDKAGANAQSANKDVSKIGLFGAFGGGGIRNKLDQAYQGAGGILGQAEKASGSSGFAENREGDDLGSKFKDSGAGGKGTATQGISGIGTKGRSSGMSAYGSTEGFGDKTSVSVEPGGAEENFVGTIDKEAVRRRIKHNINLIRGCYVQELNKKDRAGQRAFEGKIVLTWDIIGGGTAKNVRVKESSLNNKDVEKCVADRLASIQFPDPPEGLTAEVSYPFVFRPAQ